VAGRQSKWKDVTEGFDYEAAGSGRLNVVAVGSCKWNDFGADSRQWNAAKGRIVKWQRLMVLYGISISKWNEVK
jgi:hypothetical protein